MSFSLSQKQIGQRIAEFRKIKGMSQEELAKSIMISRPSMAQIELGNRNVDVLEFHRLSIVLGFSLDEFMSEDFNIIKEAEAKYLALHLPPLLEKRGPGGEAKRKPDERTAEPTLQVNKFKNVLLYILEKCAGKPNVDETFLFKLLYFSDFNFYELYEEHLTGAKYRKMPNGPVPEMGDAIIGQMIDKVFLLRVKTEYNSFPQTRFLPLVKADLGELKASEKEVIDKVINQMSDWSADSINNYSHWDMPLMATKEGEEINYELAFYREVPFAVRNYEVEDSEL